MANIKLLLSLILIVRLNAQERLQNSVAGGQWQPFRADSSIIHRYYVCGAEMNQFKSMKQHPQVCNTHCRRHFSRGKRRCAWATLCNKPPNTHEWTRSNGIKFRFCHFQKWEDQYTAEEHGNWDWKGMKMCPTNQLVYGYQIKITDRDGVAGLILHCKNPFNIRQQSQILVMDGDGKWENRISSGLASGFRIKKKDNTYINGIEFQFSPMPLINSFQIKYSIPDNLNTSPQTIDSVIVTNNGNLPMKKIIQFSKVRQFQRVWQNEKSQLNGVTLSKMFSETFSISASVSVGAFGVGGSVGASYSNTRSTTTTTTQQNMEKFAFGTVQKVTVGQMQRDEIEVGPCTKKIVRLIVYSAYVDVPYVAKIGYTNGITNEVDNILGHFRGTLTSTAETVIDEVKVC